MTRCLKYVLVILFVLYSNTIFAACGGSSPDLIPASHSDNDIQDCLDIAIDGDTITVPAGDGTETWDSGLNITKAITLQGPGKANLTIDCDTGATLYDSSRATLCVDVDVSTGTLWRITGFSFTESSAIHAHYDGVIAVRGSTDGRIDNNDFTNHNRRISKVYQTIGTALCFDNNTVLLSVQQPTLSAGLYIEPADRETQWDTPTSWGSITDAVVIEDNTFTKEYNQTGGAADGAFGAKIIFRYNTCTNMGVLVHGREANSSRSAMRLEVHDNSFIDDANKDNSAQYPIIWRGGSGLAFNNTVTGTWAGHVLHLKDYSFDDGECPGATYTYADDCDAYPCTDQIGRMYDDASGDVTNPTSTKQVLVPLAFWSNTYSAAADDIPNIFDGCAGTDPTDIMQADRDYYVMNASFDGTSGMGVGDAAAYAAFAGDCTTGVYYYESENYILYKCTDTDTWTSYYTPYADYPHPLKTPGIVSGTVFAGGGIPESTIVSTGGNIRITLDGATWAATIADAGAVFDALKAGITGSGVEVTGWNAVVRAGLVNTDVTVISTTIIDIDFGAEAGFAKIGRAHV